MLLLQPDTPMPPVRSIPPGPGVAAPRTQASVPQPESMLAATPPRLELQIELASSPGSGSHSHFLRSLKANCNN